MDISIDNFDLDIINSIYNSYKNKLDCNTWDMAKKFSKTENLTKIQRDVVLIKCYQTINFRIKKMIDYGLFIVTTNGDKKPIYTLVLDNVKIRKYKFFRKENNSICLKIRGKWVILEN